MRILRPFDYGIFLAAIALTAATAFAAYGGGGNGREFLIRGPGESWVFPQEAAETIRVPGPLGDTVVELRNGRARVLSSPCANQTCVASGEIRSHGQWIACLPNQVLVAVEGAGGEDIDAAAW
jgi:hypothetical protein